jgi:hypothetical protein
MQHLAAGKHTYIYIYLRIDGWEDEEKFVFPPSRPYIYACICMHTCSILGLGRSRKVHLPTTPRLPICVDIHTYMCIGELPALVHIFKQTYICMHICTSGAWKDEDKHLYSHHSTLAYMRAYACIYAHWWAAKTKENPSSHHPVLLYMRAYVRIHEAFGNWEDEESSSSHHPTLAHMHGYAYIYPLWGAGKTKNNSSSHRPALAHMRAYACISVTFGSWEDVEKVHLPAPPHACPYAWICMHICALGS